MERYSIFGSNTDTEYLLKLQNNESNIKIDIHNKDHNFTIDYVSSNEIITKYNTLGLKDITRIDENNYIHKSISNSSNVIIQGQYGKTENNLNEIYFRALPTFNISEEIDKVFTEYNFDNYEHTGLIEEYYKYTSINTYNSLTTEQQTILNQYTFYDINLGIIEKINLNGSLLHIEFNNKNNVSGYQFYKYDVDTDGVFPHKITFYQVFDKNAYFFDENIFTDYDKFIEKYNIDNNSFVSDELIIHIESVLIHNSYFQKEINKFKDNTDTRNTNELKLINVENYSQNNFKLAMRFKGIQLFTTNERLINEYDIDMSNNSIQNVNTLTVDKLILNNVIYTDVVSSDSVLATVNKVISSDPSIKYSIVEGYFEKEYSDYTMLNSLDNTFNPARIQNIKSNIRSNLDTKYIPYVYTRYDDDSEIKIEYDSNVNIKYLLNLADLELDNTDKLMKHSNGIIYKENKVDNLEITSNLTILSNLEVKGDININSNILRWNNDIDKFTHLDGKIIQDDVIDMLSYEPKIDKDDYTISFNTEYDAFTLTYSNNNKPYYIRHPFNFRFNTNPDTSAKTADVTSIYLLSVYVISDFNCNLKIQFLDLNAKLNLYISSRFGNEDNRTQEANRGVLNYVSRTSDPQNIENDRDKKLIYSNNEHSSNYLDYYEYEVPEKVLLKQISFYDIEFQDYSNLLNSYYEKIITAIDPGLEITSIPNLYTYNAKNYLNNFAVIGYDNEWELIQHITFEDKKTVNQHKIQNINSNKKYSRYRIALNDSTNNILPFIIKDLKFHIEYTKNNSNILYNGDNINFNIANTLSINNSIRWNDYFNKDDKIRTKLIINEDQPSIADYYKLTATADTIPYAVCHINENVDDSNLLENHMLKFGLFNNDVPLPSVDYTTYSLSKNTPSVYHSLHLMNSNLYYTQSVINNFQDIKNSDYHNEFLILVENKLQDNTHTGVVGINIDKTSLSNIVNSPDSNISDINGLIVNPTVRLCAFNPGEHNIRSYMDIELNSNLTLVNSYKIILPDNSCNIIDTSAYYLKPSANHTNRTITTEWATLGSEVFSKQDIFIGKPDNSNIAEREYQNYSNIKDGEETIEYLTHIRKLLVGYPDALNLDDINSNVLTVGGSVYATHDVSTDSDISYKYNLEKIEDVRYKVEQLNGYTFERNDTNDNRRYCGLIAQEIEKVIPEVIVKKHDGKMRVLYNNLAGLFVECFKDLYKEIDELKKEVRSHRVGL